MADSTPSGYQVLARKYRPETFADLVGQDTLVRVLGNAFDADRIAQAFIMTGIRGTGKTSTARIIAKGMNCVGPDGKGGPTTEPCGECEHCAAIMEGRHVDVMEMDAASRTGVGDIREIIESVHYRAASARYKIYIIDEVHMLSANAFNALLKTLEEPPAHVKFIFATTEIRKVPVTVLSRCQRFDLRRIEPDDMLGLLRRIAKAEGGEISDEALALVVRAAEGSARDATSLLDQALSHGAGEISADQVRAMLGLADRGRVLDLFDLVLKGDAAGALAEIGRQYSDGADPLAVLRDLAEVTHWVSVIKITPEAAEDPTVSPDERARGTEMANRLPMRILTRTWQMLLKALDEVANAPNGMTAAEMAVIRLTHVADLPTPGEVVAELKAAAPAPGAPASPAGAGGGTPDNAPRDGAPPAEPPPAPDAPPAPGAPGASAGAGGGTPDNAPRDGAPPAEPPSPPDAPPAPGAPAPAPAPTAVLERPAAGGAQPAPAGLPAEGLAGFPTFAHVVALIRANRDAKLLVDVETTLRLARYQPGRIEFEPTDDAPTDLASRLGDRLRRWTGARWALAVVGEGGGRTIEEERRDERRDLEAEAMTHPLVKAVFDAFPGARLVEVRGAADIAADALPENGEEWDPFEE